jgi:hypothetical protein
MEALTLTETASISDEQKVLHLSALEGFAETISNSLRQDSNAQVTLESVISQLQKFDLACKVAQKHFPKSADGKTVVNKVSKALDERGLGGANTLFAQSVCPDEINHENGDITTLLQAHLGEVFHLGGLGGIPFAGKTGFAAFSHHIPNNGNLMILFAPHIGISDDMLLGKYDRVGQHSAGSACGAAVGAFKHCCANKHIGVTAKDPNDYQMEYIISEIAKVVGSIDSKESDNEKMAELAKEMYNICERYIRAIVDTGVKDMLGNPAKVVLLGGIQINMPRPMPDFFQPLIFELHSEGSVMEDLMPAFN